MTTGQIQDLYQNNENMRHYVDHWAWKQGVSKEEVMTYEITRLYGEQLLEKEDNEHEVKYELHQDNGIT